MHTPLDSVRVNDAFLHPLDGLVATSPHLYACPEYSDEDWLRLGIQRVLERVESGRAFLQEHGPASTTNPPAPTTSQPKTARAGSTWPAP